MNFKIPDKDTYRLKIKDISDLFNRIVKTGSTNIGSGVYELLIRPMCIMYTTIEETLERWHDSYTLQRLSVSDNTDIGPADAILSNYFITRKAGSNAVCTITIYSTDKFTKVPSGTVFSIGDIQLTSVSTTYGYYDKHTVMTDKGGVYVKAYMSGEFYCFPVVAQTTDVSDDIVSEGADVAVDSYVPSVVRAVLSSALTGGSGIETDAEMVARARVNVSNWVGSTESIHKILTDSGLPVYSSKSFDAGDPEMCRANKYTMYMNTGGMIDTYVKTAPYPMSGVASVSMSNMGVTSNTIDISSEIPPAVLSISKITTPDGIPLEYSVLWGSNSDTISDIGARLSVYQTTSIKLSGQIPNGVSSVLVYYTYMPHIKELQEYINRPDKRIMGWDILVKSAVPSVFTLRGKLHYAYNDISVIKAAIKSYVNNLPVGIDAINLSDIQSILTYNYNTLLSSPVLLAVSDMHYSGSIVPHTDSSGVLRIPGDNIFTSRVKFLCVESSGVLIE